MWNCEIVRGDTIAEYEDILWRGEMGGAQNPQELVHIVNRTGDVLGSLAIKGWLVKGLAFTSNGFMIEGAGVDVEDTHLGFRSKEQWYFSCQPEG